jgi:hypothetical protein
MMFAEFRVAGLTTLPGSVLVECESLGLAGMPKRNFLMPLSGFANAVAGKCGKRHTQTSAPEEQSTAQIADQELLLKKFEKQELLMGCQTKNRTVYGGILSINTAKEFRNGGMT